MIIPEELYETFCPSYKKLIDELECKISELKEEEILDEKMEIILSFAYNYLIPWQYLEEYEM